MKSPAALEQDLIEHLIERAWDKYGPDSEDGWENWLLRHWPSKLTIGYWEYLFSDMADLPWINLWSPITDPYEFWFWIKPRKYWRRRYLFEETRPERILCRFRGHPRGMIFYNPGGFEPDGRCKDCGEDIG